MFEVIVEDDDLAPAAEARAGVCAAAARVRAEVSATDAFGAEHLAKDLGFTLIRRHRQVNHVAHGRSLTWDAL